MPSGMPSAAGPTSKLPPPISTAVGSNIPAVSSPTTKPSLSTVAAKGTTQAGSSSPGSAVSTSPSLPPKATVSSAAPESKTTTPGGPNTTFGVQTTKSSSKAPSTLTAKSPLATEVLTTTMAKPLGPHGTSTAVSPGATPHILSTGPKATTRATSASSTHHAPPRPVDTGTRPAQSQIICEKEAPDKSQVVILTLNESRTCESLKNSPLEEQFLNAVCQAKMPSFNRSRDQCIMRVASSTTDPKQLPIIDVTVWINSATSQLFESLTMNKGELEKLGVVNITHNGRTEDINMEDRFSMPLIITIVCMAASLLLVAAIYGCCHQRLSQRKNQQRLTEELQTMENGYHDNPTLEVMETSSEMQEKKINLNGELGDSWIVPMDNLTREDLEEEEDTHL
ncbi:hypothetical protein lerEdw1_000616 [Lerista edwardsae]|nr:hypothetical protein lerEdw1_000616 [Lerista edwardsae]